MRLTQERVRGKEMKVMFEQEEILKGFKYFVEARKVFAKYEGKWFSGNDNHVGDVGEYWAMRYFENREPKLAPKRTSSYDIQLNDGTLLSIKTMSRWNRSGRGGPVKGIDEKFWDYLIAIKLDDNLEVERFCIVPHKEVRKRIKDKSPFKWWFWLDEFEVEFKSL